MLYRTRRSPHLALLCAPDPSATASLHSQDQSPSSTVAPFTHSGVVQLATFKDNLRLQVPMQAPCKPPSSPFNTTGELARLGSSIEDECTVTLGASSDIAHSNSDRLVCCRSSTFQSNSIAATALVCENVATFFVLQYQLLLPMPGDDPASRQYGKRLFTWSLDRALRFVSNHLMLAGWEGAKASGLRPPL